MERWQVLPLPTLQLTFRMLVHDLPFNLATYAPREKLSDVVFNRLWRLYRYEDAFERYLLGWHLGSSGYVAVVNGLRVAFWVRVYSTVCLDGAG
jgi:hypothetical protein